MKQHLFKILGLFFIIQLFIGCSNYTKQENKKINDLSKNQFADSLWNEFASAMEANNLEYLVKKSFDTIQCVDCILIDENKREFYKSEIIFHDFLDKLMHIDSLTKREYSTYMTDSIIRVSYSIKCKSAPEGAYGLVFTFKKQNEEFYFDGMFTTP